MKFYKQIGLGLIFQVLGSLLLFILNIFFAKELNVEEFGYYNYVFSYASIIGALLCIGGSYFIPTIPSENKTSLNRFKNVYLSISLLFILIFFLIFNDYKINLFSKLLIIIGALGISMIEIIRTILVRENKTAKAYFIKFILPLIFTFLIIISCYALNYSKLNSFILSIVFPSFLISILLIFKDFNFLKLDKSFLIILAPFATIQFLYLANSHISKIFQGNLIDIKSLGFYSICLLIIKSITLVPMNLSLVYMPSISNLYINQNFDLIQKTYKNLFKINTSYLIPVVIFVFISSERILSVIDEKYLEASSFLKILLVYVFLLGFMGPNGTFLLMMKKQKLEIYNGLLLILSSLLTMFLIGHYKYGIVISFVISETLIILLKRYFVKKSFNLVLFTLKDFLKILKLTTLTIIMFYLNHLIDNKIVWLFTSALVMISCMSLFFFQLGVKFKKIEI